MPHEGAQLAPARRIPHLQRVSTPRDNGAPVGRERDSVHASLCPVRVRSCAPTRRIPQLQQSCPRSPTTMVRPSGENATALTRLPCPVRVRSSRPLAASHSFIVLSSLPETIVRPSGENATAVDQRHAP